MELRKAIGYQATGTTDVAWNGPANEARLSSDAGAATLRKMYAWVDSEGDASAKSSYKFPHHMVSADGTVGEANVRACSAAIAALNGGRGGASILDADRQGVYSHVAHHLRDAGQDVPELKSAEDDVERRLMEHVRFEVRADEGSAPILRGHAAVFNQPSEVLMFFREKIVPGAFADAIREGGTYGLWNHNPDFPLASMENDSLRLTEDDQGLRFEMDLDPDVSYAGDLLRNVRSGRVSKMSFGFSTADGGDRWYSEDGEMMRDLVKVKRLYDVSPVVFPAYPQTQVSARARLMADQLRSSATAAADEATAAAMSLRRQRLHLITKEI